MMTSSLWQPYTHPEFAYFPLWCERRGGGESFLLPNNDYFLFPSEIQTFAQASENDSWMVFRRNCFSVSCSFQITSQDFIQNKAVYVKDSNDQIQPITSLTLNLTAIREAPLIDKASKRSHSQISALNTLEPILLHHPSSNATSPPPSFQVFSADLFETIKAVKWEKLEFSTATKGNGKATDLQEYFHIVVSLVGSCAFNPNSCYYLASFISPKIMVIGQNPARYKRSKIKKLNNEQMQSSIVSCNTPNPFVTTPSLPLLLEPNMLLTSSSSSITTTSSSQTKNGNISPSNIKIASSNPTTSTSPTSMLLPPPNLSTSSILNNISQYFSEESSSPSSLQDFTTTSSPDSSSFIPIDTGGSLWTVYPDNSISRCGNVGVNVVPTEALSVGGNVLMTGDLLKPSDSRIKRNIIPIGSDASKSHLRNLQGLVMYNYDRLDLSDSHSPTQYIPERGFIAQEVQKIIPLAVQNVGPVRTPNGQIQDLLVVNDHQLLIETIGATQELGKNVEELRANTSQYTFPPSTSSLDFAFNVLTAIWNFTKAKFSYLPTQRIFDIDPAWTCTILGFFIHPLWLCGIRYIFSKRTDQQFSGLLNLILLVCMGLIKFALHVYIKPIYPVYHFAFSLFSWVVGLLVCSITFCITASFRVINSRRKREDKLEP